MLAIFKPVKNWYWFDIREFDLNEDWKPSTFRWLKVSDYKGVLLELPILKPLVRCSNKYEFYKQFQQFLN